MIYNKDKLTEQSYLLESNSKEINDIDKNDNETDIKEGTAHSLAFSEDLIYN